MQSDGWTKEQAIQKKIKLVGQVGRVCVLTVIMAVIRLSPFRRMSRISAFVSSGEELQIKSIKTVTRARAAPENGSIPSSTNAIHSFFLPRPSRLPCLPARAGPPSDINWCHGHIQTSDSGQPYSARSPDRGEANSYERLRRQNRIPTRSDPRSRFGAHSPLPPVVEL